MTRPFFNLGSCPCNETPAKFGEPNFRLNSLRDCQSYIQAIRNYLGYEPEGAKLEYKAFDGDRGLFYDVIISYDPTCAEAEAYAKCCERQAPHTWEEGGVKPPQHATARKSGRALA